jgi:tight adherence protein C
MTFVLVLIGLLMVAATGRLVAHAIALPRLKLKQHLSEIVDYGFSSRSVEAPTTEGRSKDTVRELAGRIGRFALARAPALRPLGRGELAAAGFYDVSPETVHGYRVLAAAGVALIVGFLGFAAVGPSPISVLLVAGGAAAGWQLPAVVIRGRGTRRLDQIDKDLPELIDLLIATVEAGMGFGGSLKLVADRLPGALGDEVRLTIRHQNLGISTTEALEDMLERCDSLSMRSFVRTVVRGESMGLSISPILRELTVDMRRRRRQTLQERMHKAPVKVLFPLMFLIMPALMIVLFYPAAYSVMKGLSGIG